ncbi:formate dehydrogenase subunit delta [Kribbella sp. VKM Ac-2527]|uniref:Formate dehydrogenase subunit delta n=1 Tax=Kribbella caucasensis TaxID=2512215 RepID=A0A4R6KHT6_9ACTN|nr:formate dehydrogenase subunit delta [Kribbella sp. VKM Ac-2527]TDO50574.1 formate dehydrogenase subunit delta [Kribbella sp. VKM Ac-2527]
MSGVGLPPQVRLANEIARQFAHRTPADAATAIATHIRAVWDPRMKAALIAHLDAGGEDLDPVAALAAAQLRPVDAQGAK